MKVLHSVPHFSFFHLPPFFPRGQCTVQWHCPLVVSRLYESYHCATMRLIAALLFAPAVLAQTVAKPVLTESGFNCFLTTPELRDAVDGYLEDPFATSAIATKYGWPIGNWCVRNIADFSYMCDSNRNPKCAGFNEDLTGWVTTSARDMSFMFAGPPRSTAMYRHSRLGAY